MQKQGQMAGKFPATKEDVALARKNLTEMILQKSVITKMVVALQHGPEEARNKIGQIIGMAVARLIMSASQRGKVHKMLVAGLIKVAVQLVAKAIKAAIRADLPVEDQQAIAMVAGQVLEQTLSQQKGAVPQGQQQPPGQEQMMGAQPGPEQMMQGAPQEATGGLLDQLQTQGGM